MQLVLSVLKMIDLKAIRLRFGKCPLCGTTIFVRLGNHMSAIRCLSCGATPVAMAIGSILKSKSPDFCKKKIYELSSRGPFFNFLKRNVKALTYSEYFDDIPPGKYKGTIQCQDVQHLTYHDESFDICTSTEVFEHVPHDKQGFAEIFRVLKPGGLFIFTVPLRDSEQTIERATLENGKIKYLLRPEYHDDYMRGSRRVLTFRSYGRDIVDRLTEAGFESAEIINGIDFTGMGYTGKVIAAQKIISGQAKNK